MFTITQAATQLRTTPRMLRYRESLGLLPGRRPAGTHRRYDDEALRVAGYAMSLEQRYGVPPSALAFALRVLVEPAVAADVRRLGELAGRRGRTAIAALDFEQEKGRRLLGN